MASNNNNHHHNNSSEGALPRKQVRFSFESSSIVTFRRYNQTSMDKSRSWLSKQVMMLHADTNDDECFQDRDRYRIKRDLTRLFDCPVEDRIEILIRLNRDHFHLRGLERRVCQEHGNRMSRMKRESVQAVLTLQHQQRIHHNHQQQLGTQEDKALQLAVVSQERSQGARVLARLLAISDQQVLRDLDNDKQEQHAPPCKVKSEPSKSPRFRLSSHKMRMTLRHSDTAPSRLTSLLWWNPNRSVQPELHYY
jgi:hypothetical protein